MTLTIEIELRIFIFLSIAEVCSSCILLTDCPPMLRLLGTRTRRGILTVQQAICGFEGSRSKVCILEEVDYAYAIFWDHE